MIRHRSIDVSWGVVHAREVHGADPPVVALHQTPRSGDEFREVLDRLDGTHHALALDLAGMGHSTPHPDGDRIAAYAAAVAAALRAEGIGRCHLVGHHTGAAVAAELAAEEPGLVETLVLSSPPWIDAEARRRRAEGAGPGVDEVTRAADGSHLGALWGGRAGFYPDDRPDLLDRFVADTLLVAEPAAGHRAVSAWEVEAVIEPLRTLVVVLVDHTADPFAHPHIARWAAELPRADVRAIEGGMVPLEHTADAFAALLLEVIGDGGTRTTSEERARGPEPVL